MSSRVEIFYDGACPFCSNYVSLMKLREQFDVTLVDLRTRPDLVAEFSAEGMDVSEGMIVRFPGSVHYGSDALNALSLVSSGKGTLNAISAFIFRNGWLAKLLYPPMKLGRRATLAVLGISPHIPASEER